MGVFTTTRGALVGGIGLAALALAAGAASAEPLVIEGEQIADSALMEAAAKEGSLLYYGTYPEASMQPILDAFGKDTGITAKYLRLTGQMMYSRIVAEHDAGRLPADVADVSDMDWIQDLVEKGIFNQPHKVPSFDVLPEELRDDEGRWYTLVRPIFVIGVNTARVTDKAEYPKAWKDLLDPKWKGEITTASIDAGGSTFVTYSYLREKYDVDYWKALAAQGPMIFPGGQTSLTELVRGEASVAPSGLGQLSSQVALGAPIAIVIPEDGVAAFGTYGGITAKAPHPNAAKVFLNWMTSKRAGQFVGPTGAYGVHPDAPPPKVEGATLPSGADVWSMSAETWIERREPWSKEWRQIFQGK